MSIQTTARHACTHEDGYIVYPGEITQDASGKVREDGMRLACEDCRQVLDYTGA